MNQEHPIAPPGWHVQADGRERYWDGRQWTEQYRAVPVAIPSPSHVAPAGKKSGLPGWWKLAAVGGGSFLLGLIIGGVGGSSSTEAGPKPTPTVVVTRPVTATKSATVTATPTVTLSVTAGPPAPAVAIREGTWTVGRDIEPGTYTTTAEVASDCYWSITKSGTNGGDIIENDIVKGGKPTVTLREGQDFKTSRCGGWTKIG